MCNYYTVVRNNLIVNLRHTRDLEEIEINIINCIHFPISYFNNWLFIFKIWIIT